MLLIWEGDMDPFWVSLHEEKEKTAPLAVIDRGSPAGCPCQFGRDARFPTGFRMSPSGGCRWMPSDALGCPRMPLRKADGCPWPEGTFGASNVNFLLQTLPFLVS